MGPADEIYSPTYIGARVSLSAKVIALATASSGRGDLAPEYYVVDDGSNHKQRWIMCLKQLKENEHWSGHIALFSSLAVVLCP